MQPISPIAFRRTDESPDREFYSAPRLVTHIDNGAIAAATQIYREFLPANGVVLDLMSSWISHLPPEIQYAEVVGLGMNAEELNANPRLTERSVHDLNVDSNVPFADSRFDAAVCCVSIDYLTDPIAVLQDVGRTLKPDVPFVITFSNRCFPTKAVAIWHALDDMGRIALVSEFFTLAGNYNTETIQMLDRSPQSGDPLYAVVARRL